MKQTEKNAIGDALDDRLAKNLLCPMCQTFHFTILEKYGKILVSSELESDATTTMPCIILVCNRCGFMSHHAAGPLGLLPKEGQND